MTRFVVTVARIEPRSREFVVEADSREEATRFALRHAVDFDFYDAAAGEPTYEVESVKGDCGCTSKTTCYRHAVNAIVGTRSTPPPD